MKRVIGCNCSLVEQLLQVPCAMDGVHDLNKRWGYAKYHEEWPPDQRAQTWPEIVTQRISSRRVRDLCCSMAELGDYFHGLHRAVLCDKVAYVFEIASACGDKMTGINAAASRPAAI
jgi:hypothetical protein